MKSMESAYFKQAIGEIDKEKGVKKDVADLKFLLQKRE